MTNEQQRVQELIADTRAQVTEARALREHARAQRAGEQALRATSRALLVQTSETCRQWERLLARYTAVSASLVQLSPPEHWPQ